MNDSRYLESVASLVDPNERVLQRLKTRGRRYVSSIVAAVNVEKSIVTLLNVLNQLENL